MTIPTTVNYPTSLDDDNTLFADPVNNLSLTLATSIDNRYWNRKFTAQ